ncbi:uncharacterized protein [Physcomitrium patens]|uniref:uncharacterized protein isoform X2 n=1 Tax=Physcomitrium patens TaxID=3218 RepID=UPI003CCD7D2F
MVSKGDRWARSSFRWNYLGGHADQYEVGSKRQRLIDGGSSPVLLQGHPRSLPVVDYALQKNRHNIGRRYIEVFRCKKQDYYHAVAAEVADTRCIDSTLPLHVLNNNSSSASAKAPSRNNTKDHLNFTGVVKLRGLPFSATKSDVMDFFREFELHDEHVHIMLHSDGRTTGEAFVDFGSASKAKSAMNKDKMTMGSRYVEIFPSSREEATRAATR